MSVMQMKRGTSQLWNGGRELVDFSKLKVNGKDSTILCEGTHLKMKVFTSSAENFSSLESSLGTAKRNGLNIIMPGEINMGPTTYDVAIKAPSLPAGCEVRLYYTTLHSLTGEIVSSSKACTLTSSVPSASLTPTGSGHNYVVVLVLWDDETKEDEEIDIYVSVKMKDISTYYGYQEGLYPGQIGVEYVDGNGSLLKVGPGGANSMTAWSQIPYVGQIIPPGQYVNSLSSLPASAPIGSIYYVKRSS